jgi:hypothetical protein
METNLTPPHIYSHLEITYCRRFGHARTVNRLVNLSLRVPAQMG